ncbi:MAG: YtxH domain-containing protein [Parafilimonas sp.]
MFKLLQAALIGIGIGILIAPDKGSATRRKILNAVSDYKDDAQDYLEDTYDTVKSKAEDVAHNVKTKAKKMAGKANSKADDLIQDVENN